MGRWLRRMAFFGIGAGLVVLLVGARRRAASLPALAGEKIGRFFQTLSRRGV